MNRRESLNGLQPEIVKNTPLYVMKFGGSSLGSARSIDEHVAGFINYHRKDGRQIVIVASAMKGVTSDLSSVSDMLQYSPSDADHYMRKVYMQHMGVINELMVSPLARLEIQEEFNSLYNKLVRFIGCVKMVTPDVKDEIISFGERFIAPIVAGTLRNHFIDAEAVDARDVIVTDDQFGEAVVAVEDTRTDSITSLIRKGKIPVVTGFIGATRDGRTTTLGPNSSDYTAAIIGVMLGAKEVWICKDVKGLYDGQGNVISRLSYDDVFAVEGGTKVVHALAIRLLKSANIPIGVKCTFEPEREGTLIFESSQSRAQRVKYHYVLDG